MSPPRDSFGDAMAAIVTALSAGRFPPGARLVTTQLAAELRQSPTPTREALAQLVGAGVIEEVRRLGYFVPRPRPRELAELYETAAVLSDALAARLPAASPAAIHLDVGFDLGFGPFGTTPAHRLGDALTLLAVRGDAVALVDALIPIYRRLAPYRRVESIVLPDAEAETQALATLAASADPETLRPRIAAYHAARAAVAERLCEAADGPRYAPASRVNRERIEIG